MVSEGCSQILKLAAGCCLRAALPDISITRLAVDTRQCGRAEEIEIADSRGAVFDGDVVGERSLSFRSFAVAETSASFEPAIADDLHGLFDDSTVLVPSRWLQPESCTFAVTRHRSLIWLIA